MESSNWAKDQLSQLLPLDEESLQQVLNYTASLPKDAAAEHLKNLLGDSARSLEFISSYNSRRNAPSTSSNANATLAPNNSSTPVPKSQSRKKTKQPLNKPFVPRQVEHHSNTSGAYQKKDQDDYMVGRARVQGKDKSLVNTLELSDKPESLQLPKSTTASGSKTPPSASGPLISDLPNVRSKSAYSSRNASPAPKATVNVTGGQAMHGAAATLQDLDSAIRSLEMATNPSLPSNMSSSARACSCNATKHPLLGAAPNCLNCGKIICVKEGIGPCTYCGRPLLSSTEVQGMIDSLKQERGQERMQANNASYRKADVSASPRPFANPAPPAHPEPGSEAFDLAKQHRDRLLGYQAENARRTHVIDEAADYETPMSGLSRWSSPVDRAAQLKRQQKVLREQEWNAKPAYEKKKVVVSVDLVGGKVVKRMADADRPEEPDEEIADDRSGMGQDGPSTIKKEGTFSRNPLLGNLIRPIWKSTGKEAEKGPESSENKQNGRHGPSTWRRVQDDEDDNEAWILDGGIYGSNIEERRLGMEERGQV